MQFAALGTIVAGSGGCSSLFRSQNQTIRDNTGNLYPAWSKLGTMLRLIPLLGGIDADVLIPDTDGKTAFEKEIAYFGSLMAQYPGRNVIYQGKPLMVIFLGAAQDPNPSDSPLWWQLEQFVKQHPEIEAKYTFRLMAGYLDAQPDRWRRPGRLTAPSKSVRHMASGAGSIALTRLARSLPAPISPPTTWQAPGWRTSLLPSLRREWRPDGAAPIPTRCPIVLTIRFAGPSGTRTRPWNLSWRKPAGLSPIFLFIHQFNEFTPPDQGFDANTDDDISRRTFGAALPVRVSAVRSGCTGSPCRSAEFHAPATMRTSVGDWRVAE